MCALSFTVLTIFPEMISGYVREGVIGRAIRAGLLDVKTIDIRDFTFDRHRTVDDVPFGGGAGMVMKPEPIALAFDSMEPVERRILLAPHGRPFRQQDAEELSHLSKVALLCGRYEGIDERVIGRYIDDVISIGDYVLSGGELAALCVLDATSRLVPGVLGNAESPVDESFGSAGLLEYPQYTRPAEWRGEGIPEILLSGHHAHIKAWRRRQSLCRTVEFRPDLLESAELTAEEQRYVLELKSGETEENEK